ncbi:MAG: outer membrane lipid asymmetry maintenance protein MlaD [Gammaproteobacteria bacterium]|jgi:phospholipid/cholesterol/gamma-HCH transport system substrate-binding protein
MDSKRKIEIWVGLFVAAGFAALFMLAMKVSNLSAPGDAKGYTVTAEFQNIGGLKVRAPVTMAGVTIGRVTGVNFDPKSFKARVTMNIEDRYNFLPADSQASIYTAGLLGEQYIAIQPGAEDAVLKNGGQIMYTQSAVILEQIVGKILVSLTSK